MFRPEGSQPRLAIIFCEQGIQICDNEKMLCHPDVNVFFQQIAWLDQYVCIKWCKKTLLPFVNGQDFSKFVLLLDNLNRQMQDDFKESISSIN